MTTHTKDEILVKAEQLATMIAATPEVEVFKQAEAKLNENEKVQKMISEIKAIQKQAVNLEHYGKTEALQRANATIDAIQEELYAMPVVQQFMESQVEVNDLLQLVANTLSNSVTNEIIRSTEGDLLAGETGSRLKAKEANIQSGSCGDGCGCNS